MDSNSLSSFANDIVQFLVKYSATTCNINDYVFTSLIQLKTAILTLVRAK